MSKHLRKAGALAASVVMVAVLAAAVTVDGSSAAPARGITGTWYGETSQHFAEVDATFESRIAVSALHGRLVGLATTVRMLCAEVSVNDARVLKSYRVGRGPKLTPGGGFSVSLVVAGARVRVDGRLGKRSATGHVAASTARCGGEGDWTARKRL